MGTLEQLKNLNGELLIDEPLSAHTGFRTGGKADAMFFPCDRVALAAAVGLLKQVGGKYCVVGNGSNLVAPDGGYRGVIICTTHLNSIKRISDTEFYCDCGVMLRDMCEFSLANCLAGAEFAFGIPGTVGGAVFMNAGAYGGEMKEILSAADVLDGGKIVKYDLDAMGLSYRSSVFHSRRDIAIVGAYFKMRIGLRSDIKQLMEENLSKRKQKQPLNFPSCGSTFKRPEGHFAGALIDASGLRGVAVGGAAVSEKHAGFIINKGGATSKDIFALIDLVKGRVLSDSGVKLETEIEILE